MVQHQTPGHILVLDLDHILVRKVIRQKRAWERWTVRGPREQAVPWPVLGREEAGPNVVVVVVGIEHTGDRYFLGDPSHSTHRLRGMRKRKKVTGVMRNRVGEDPN